MFKPKFPESLSRKPSVDCSLSQGLLIASQRERETMEKGAVASDSTRQALDDVDADYNFQVQDIVASESAADRQIAAADEIFQL